MSAYLNALAEEGTREDLLAQVTRLIEERDSTAAAHAARVAELLETNNREVEQRRIAERALDASSFQRRVGHWMQACFGPAISSDRLERGDRLLEEVLELLQSGDYPVERVAALTGYVWSRPAGEPSQEVGGVEVTLAAYCLAHGLDKHEAAEVELARIWTKVEKIRAKQAAKPTGSALPLAWPVAAPPAPVAVPDGWVLVNDGGKRWHICGPAGRWAMKPEGAITADEARVICETAMGTSLSPTPAVEPYVDGIEQAAEYLCRTAFHYSYAGIRDDGSIRDRGYEPVIHSQWGGPKFQGHKDDLRAMVREIVRLAAPAAEEVFRPTHRHLKRGSEYCVIGEAEAQVSTGTRIPFFAEDGSRNAAMDWWERELSDRDRLTVYQGADGKLWVRFTDEFNDGRFAALETEA